MRHNMLIDVNASNLFSTMLNAYLVVFTYRECSTQHQQNTVHGKPHTVLYSFTF